ncbi:hypothetical protein ACROSR_02225 [Roseovarius tibetensis]|uniref:hypothetical protein n=1 Tax=Roseovarius tibetensis TaxID=2685897 RepID=UPI003D7FA422
MIDLKTEIETVQSMVEQADPDTRYKHEPELRDLIDRMHNNDMAVPAPVKRLHQILLTEAIEAEFDNMPI